MMPYKDPEQRKQAARDSMERKRRGLTSGVNISGVNGQGLTSLKRPNRMGVDGTEMVENEYNPDELMNDGSKRYAGPFSDGQVLDRKTVPLPDRTLITPKFTPVKKRLSEAVS